MDDYQKLIENKVVAAEYNGFDICPSEIHPSLFDILETEKMEAA